MPVPERWDPDLEAHRPSDWYDCRELSALEKPKTRQQEIPIRPSDHSFFAAGEDIPRDHDILVKRVPWPEAQARADEIVAAYRAWDAECEAVERSVGFDRSDDVSDEIHDKINVLEDGIIDIPEKTLPGLRAKAMAVAWCYLGVEKFLSEDPGGQAIGDQIAFSMVRDLLQLPQELRDMDAELKRRLFAEFDDLDPADLTGTKPARPRRAV